MKLDIRYNNHPDDVKNYDTKTLRHHFLVEKIFADDEILLTYSHHDRIIFGGIKPVKQTLHLGASKELGTDYFLERRELGLINIGGDGLVEADGVEYRVNHFDGLYLPCLTKIVSFSSLNAKDPAKFYLASSPAHQRLEAKHIPLKNANPRPIGEQEHLNKRTIYQYLHPAVLKTCQLSMGMTMLDPGNAWNTWPPHTHERRMEVYLYFNFDEKDCVFHMMGQAEETRHIKVANEQAVISPSWSIHSGIGTKNYIFIWAMCGENLTFDDMDNIVTKDIK
ncbi:MAG: 5-dehydro-4-deoxy-D-glucuronate isomerase [Acholeplasmatales bacterium]|jgi:4-deoxy-L-threo-5-hexosulose-uronate ketol-isomerase|nr:5-dehydro-4-deoxy-D-glucuronate isomerase [Acholeplasmatales bacterium]